MEIIDPEGHLGPIDKAAVKATRIESLLHSGAQPEVAFAEPAEKPSTYPWARRFEYVDANVAAKRLGIRWAPWMGDWFVAWSPRNDNTHAEGEWDQWVDLAIQILQSPLTELTRPAAHEAVQGLGTENYYTGSKRYLEPDELQHHFAADLARDEAQV